MAELPAAAPALAGNIEAEVAVVGAGLGGVTAAYLMARDGRRVVVIDSGPPGGGMTGRTTAHLTTALDDRWKHLLSIRSEEDARVAADAHAAAIDLVEEIQRHEGIACDFTRVDGYLLPARDEDRGELTEELEAAHRAGLLDVALEPDGLRFPRQARFHPLKYLGGLKDRIERAGGRFVTAHISSVEEAQSRVTLKTSDGHMVRAEAAVIATNTPINDRVAIHTKMAPYRSYVIAGRVPHGSVADRLVWDTGWPYHYVRLQPMGEDDVLIVGGEDHKTGQAEDMDTRFQRLEAWARARYPSLQEIEWRWSGQVMESVDDLGYLGRNPGNERIFIITGDSGMGMTHTTIGARVASDLIARRGNPWVKLFDPGRISLMAAGTYAQENLNVAAQLTDHVTPGEVGSVDDIAPGQGALMRRGLHKIAVYRSFEGEVTERSAVCPHVGCVVAWNRLEGCWDCPCHGSQFAADGRVINGPATSDLAEVEEQHVRPASPVAHRPGRSAAR
jgi:hypothetical protein